MLWWKDSPSLCSKQQWTRIWARQYLWTAGASANFRGWLTLSIWMENRPSLWRMRSKTASPSRWPPSPSGQTTFRTSAFWTPNRLRLESRPTLWSAQLKSERNRSGNQEFPMLAESLFYYSFFGPAETRSRGEPANIEKDGKNLPWDADERNCQRTSSQNGFSQERSRRAPMQWW